MMSIPLSVPSLSLEGKVAIVTGGGTGIGRAIALEFARAGADVVVASRTLANLEKVAEEVRALGRRSLAVQTDVTKKSDVENLAQRTVDEFGDIDILVNNAGVGSGTGDDGRGIGGKYAPWLIELPEDTWDIIIDIDLKGYYLCCQAVGKRMVERKKGNIISISSEAAFRGTASPYGVAKAGVNRLTTGLAKELGPYNIRVNAIAPGWVLTDVGVVTKEEEYAAMVSGEMTKGTPLERVGQPIDIATVALFLASEASNHVTGEIIEVSGGSRL